MYGNMATDMWYNQTTLHPIGVLALLVLGVATFVVPRRYALVPMLILACFVAPAQRVVIATLDFNFLRIMILLGWMRVMFRGETSGFRWKTIDTIMMSWGLCATAVALLVPTTFAALINRMGLLYDAIGLYFLCRFLVRDWRDLFVFARAAAVVSIPVALAFMIEKTTGRNVFSIFGGVSEFTTVRAGRLRCQGPFTHPILAGCFWAALAPLIAALWWRGSRDRLLAVIGVACSLVVVFACASATPVGGLLAGCFAAALYPLRRYMSWIRMAAILGLIVLQLLMTNPIWHLLARVDFVSGSTGWYRFKLIDEFIRHFDEWWLAGTDTYVTWWTGRFEAITNEYVLQGIQGGMITLLLYLAVIACAFYGVGRILRHAAQRRYRLVPVTGQPSTQPASRRITGPRSSSLSTMAWAIGVSLFIQCACFTSVSCFGQAVFIWFLTIGFIGSLTPARQGQRVVLQHASATDGDSPIRSPRPRRAFPLVGA